MINIRLEGGLGNQLFQYALGKSFQARGQKVTYNMQKLGLWSRQYALAGFDTKVPLGPQIGSVIHEGTLRFQPGIFLLRDATLEGYWQCERYFLNVADELRSELIPTNLGEYTPDLSVVPRDISDSIAVHVRRGDYCQEPYRSFHGLLPKEYFLEGVARLFLRYPKGYKPAVYVFSDDADYCRETYPHWHVIKTNPWFDMWLMSRARHRVISNSPFSWWGAWIGDKDRQGTVIAPKKWFATANADGTDICPERWLRI